MVQVSSRRVRVCVVGLAAAALAALVPLSPFATAAPTPDGVSPVRVDASYKISLNGFSLGTFQFKSDVGRTRYTLDTDVEISALLGVFKWKGVTHTSGSLKAKTPKPADFRFNYESSIRSGSVAMGFDKEGIERVSVLPATMEAPDTVPLTPAHLKGVFDPLSAILAITHSDASSPCGRKIPIFDGKQRFDIALRFAREEPVVGRPDETAVVCRVKYTPIAGYRPTEETRQLATSNDIEIAFRMVPAAKLMLPQSVAVPTPAGSARIDLERVSIELPERGQVASAD
ncbi:DUF3108 domain-containing protein [Hyphomicrobium sp.]|uniref:DUF3108 domain-containing protein n=1 Tax=Hyphomicrobium sp. TaxID=82 RepID=UPI0025BC1039|nr:DUF3108 domain-containing protein [Hyphomicrobium sp.]MCC7254077.1 DUF3108 domain-containing protein [Hyphomicrobium sp.]